MSTSSLRPDHYPASRIVGQVDTYHGTSVADPFRWLENADDPEVLSWTQAQHDLAASVLEAIPARAGIRSRLEEVWNFPRMDQPFLRGGRLFFTRNTGLEAQARLFVQEPDGSERVLIDPNTLSSDGTVALMEWAPSDDGRMLAYALSQSGEDWRTVHVRSVDDGADLPDRLEHIKFSWFQWHPDGSGFFYSGFPSDASDGGEANRDQTHQLWFHRPGTDQATDEKVFEHPSLRGIILSGTPTDDGAFLIVGIHGDSFVVNALWYAELGSRSVSDLDLKPLFDEHDAIYEAIGTHGDALLVHTTKGAPRGRIVRVDPAAPSTLDTIIPETDGVIAYATVASDQIVVTRTEDAHDTVELFTLDGAQAGTIELPAVGATAGAGLGARSFDTRIYLTFSTFLAPTSILAYDFASRESSVVFSARVAGFDPSAYETRLLFATSPDGTRVPVFVTGSRITSGASRTILSGYGGFGVSMKPAYPSWLPAWIENGGVFAQAVLRGGGEYGDTWHRAGMFERKQNVFNDFHAAADLLVEEGITTPAALAIEGGSNGGLLVAATVLQQPQKYGAVLCHVPVADMLRYQHFSAGRYWTGEYGDADKDADHFKALRAYSPVHNVTDGAEYPPVLIMSADHDDRVVPMHSKKLAARMQQADPGTNTVLLRIETRAGHGAGKPTAKQIDLRADALAFLSGTLA